MLADLTRWIIVMLLVLWTICLIVNTAMKKESEKMSDPTPGIRPVPVLIGGESGERVTIERNVVSEHVVYRSDIGTWPKDRASQRAWALSVVTQKLIPLFKAEDGMEDLFAQAQQIVDWVQDGKLPK